MKHANLDYYPMSIWLEFSEQDQLKAWQDSQPFSHTSHRQFVYLNQLLQQRVLPYLQESFAEVRLAEEAINLGCLGIKGVAFTLGTHRLVIIPSESIDCDEIEIPQEWIDTDLAADIYMAAQVDTQDRTIRLWGYTTLQQLLKQGSQRSFNHCYGMDADHLTERISTLGLQLQFFPEAMKSSSIHHNAQRPLSLDQLTTLMDQIVAEPYPRQAIAFDQWCAVINNLNWRRTLVERITAQGATKAEPVPPPTRLSQWFDHQLQSSWQPIQHIIQPQLLSSFMDSRIKQAKIIDLGMEFSGHKFALMLILDCQEETYAIQASVYPTGEQTTLPPELKLRVLTDIGEVFKEVTARVDDEFIRYKFEAQLDDRFLIQVALGDAMVEESFQV